jgi:hypothetical protein
MAIYVRRYHNCTPLTDDAGAIVPYTGSGVTVTNDTEGILKVTVTNPARQLEPLKEYILNIEPGAVGTIPATLLDRDGVAITTQSECVAIVEGSTVPEYFSAATAIAYA